MPRIQPSLVRHAKRLSPHLASLLPACRDLESARHELRWIKSHVDKTWVHRKAWHLEQLCYKRGHGVPLQYVLGSQPFGSLDIKCAPGVLIPRPETEAYTFHLADLIKSGELLGKEWKKDGQGLNLIDFCSGTGCIPLGLFSSLQRSVAHLRVRGVDISPVALKLANENIARNMRLDYLSQPNDKQTLEIARGDVFSDSDVQQLADTRWDILISNPPYISNDVWNHGRGQLGLSVRKYEPRLALVPDSNLPCPAECDPADVFYSRLLDIGVLLKPKVMLLEIGDENQARRVLQLYFAHSTAKNSRAEVWRDWPDLETSEELSSFVDVKISEEHTRRVPVKGDGLIRSILIKSLDGEQ
ncbi:MTS domain-containing protein [Fusarium keratoplasticum]|uniref:MTS domain-containing protein n=1 Tax=Fusarium keratoplasticum TaxID=1328300 RepID=A0ACC0QLG4_9HYPO|nr:MTS domain-containing protein [Fusarium keratoplasticum]KAI8657576.1 MTS domain-containing protein [Fusarium keratoplasticum]